MAFLSAFPPGDPYSQQQGMTVYAMQSPNTPAVSIATSQQQEYIQQQQQQQYIVAQQQQMQQQQQQQAQQPQ